MMSQAFSHPAPTMPVSRVRGKRIRTSLKTDSASVGCRCSASTGCWWATDRWAVARADTAWSCPSRRPSGPPPTTENGRQHGDAPKTDVVSVAKLRLGDFEKQQRQRAESSTAAMQGKMTVGDAISIHRQRVADDADVFDQSLNGLDYITRCLDAGLAHEKGKFGLGDSDLTLSHSTLAFLRGCVRRDRQAFGSPKPVGHCQQAASRLETSGDKWPPQTLAAAQGRRGKTPR